jgi:hypothetical protein
MNPVYVLVAIGMLSNGAEYYRPIERIHGFSDNRALCFARLERWLKEVNVPGSARRHVCMLEERWISFDPSKVTTPIKSD